MTPHVTGSFFASRRRLAMAWGAAATKQEARSGGTPISDVAGVPPSCIYLGLSVLADASHHGIKRLHPAAQHESVCICVQNMLDYMEWQRGKKTGARGEREKEKKKYELNRGKKIPKQIRRQERQKRRSHLNFSILNN